MKNSGLFLIAALAAFTLSSCNESKGDYPAYGEFVSAEPLADGGYYFKSDNDKTLFPGDKSRIGAYEVKDTDPRQRAVVYFNMLPEKAEGYDYNIQLYQIYDIYTAAAKVVTTQEELDALGDAQTSYINRRFNKNFLTLEVAYPVRDNSQHKFSLIVNDTDPDKAPTNEGYLDVELRHDAGSDSDGHDEGFYLSFDLKAIQDRLEGKKGITLRVNTQLNGVKLIQLDLPKTE